MPNQDLNLHTIAEAAVYLDVHLATVYRWLQHGELNGLIIGGNYYIEMTVLDQFIDNHSDDYELQEEIDDEPTA